MIKKEIKDIKYMVIWTVSLDENRAVKGVAQYSVVDMARFSNGKRPLCIDFKPSKKFIQRAKKQIIQLDWSEYKPCTTEASAISYLYSADPDSPVSTNEQRR